VGFPIKTELKNEESPKTDAFRGGFEAAGSARAGAGPDAAPDDANANVGAGVGAGVGASVGVEVDVAVTPVQLGIGRWSRWIAVAGGLGYVPIAPGTAGSFGGVLLFLLMLYASPGISRASLLALYAFVVGVLLLLGIRAAGRAEVDFGRRDDGRIVIDEVVGQLIALLPLAWLVPLDRIADEGLFLVFPGVVTGFVLFRLFDVWKPGAVRWAERRFEGGLGVMADDVLAGLYAGFGLFVLQLLVFERFLSSSSVSSVSGVSA
jgi:phosphatidylglycerophosphatase A